MIKALLLNRPHPGIEYWYFRHWSALAYFTALTAPIINIIGISIYCVWTLREPNRKRRLTGCGVCVLYMMLWVRVVVKWSHSPRCSLTLNFWGCVCIWRPLTSAPGTCLRSLLSISDASARARTSDTHKHTLGDWEMERKSTWLLLVVHTNTNGPHPHNEDDKLYVSHCVYIPPCSKRLLKSPTRACVHAFEYTHKVVSDAHF